MEEQKNTYENVPIPSGIHYPIELGNHTIYGNITNNGVLSLGNGVITSYGATQSQNTAIGITNNGTVYINGNVGITGGNENISGGAAIWSRGGEVYTQGTNNVITGSGVSAIYMDAGKVTINSGTTVSSSASNAVSINAGTFNAAGGIIQGGLGYGILSQAGSSVNISAGTVGSVNKAGIVSKGSLTITGGQIYTKTVGNNAVRVSSGSFYMNDGEIYNQIDDNNCVGALTFESTSTNGGSVDGGYIHGCVGINYQSGATGKIYITINNSNASTKTNITGAHTGININSTVDNVLNIGSSGSKEYFPLIASSGNYYGVDLHDSSRKFVLYSGHIRSGGKSAVFRGTRAGSCPSGTTFQKAAGSGYYDAWCH